MKSLVKQPYLDSPPRNENALEEMREKFDPQAHLGGIRKFYARRQLFRKSFEIPEPKTYAFEKRNYLFLTPAHTGSRSFCRFLLKRGILSYPGITFVEGNTDEEIEAEHKNPNTYLLSNARHAHSKVDFFRGDVVLLVRHPLKRVVSAYMHTVYPYEYNKIAPGFLLPQRLKLEPFTKASLNRDKFTSEIRTKYPHLTDFEFGFNDLSIDYYITNCIAYYNLVTDGDKYEAHMTRRRPQYVINTETQEQDMLKLPFIRNTDGYVKYPTYPPAYRDMYAEKSKYVTDYIKSNRKLADLINERFSTDFEAFGFDVV